MDNVIDIASGPRGFPQRAQVPFTRLELMTILDLYGRMVSAGVWKDYAIQMNAQEAVFHCFRRAAERPDCSIVKRPDLARKQGEYALVGQAGGVLKRGQDLRQVLKLLERKLMKAVEA
jgi:hypothetical protein